MQSREPTNSTHIWHWIWESNPGHIVGGKLSAIPAFPPQWFIQCTALIHPLNNWDQVAVSLSLHQCSTSARFPNWNDSLCILKQWDVMTTGSECIIIIYLNVIKINFYFYFFFLSGKPNSEEDSRSALIDLIYINYVNKKAVCLKNYLIYSFFIIILLQKNILLLSSTVISWSLNTKKYNVSSR